MAMHKFIMAVVFLVLTATAANAYTLVMRSGRRIEIPDQFAVAGSTLTFTVGSGAQITYQLNGIDIAATERANGEPYGSFLARASSPANAPAPPSQTAQPRAQRSITNRDLEGYRRTRVESEIAYEKRRKELGLPNAEDRRKEFAAIQDRTREQLLSRRAEEQSAEEYWRGRANALRNELLVNQAQINYVRSRLDEIPVTNSLNTFATASPFGAPVLNFPLQNPFTTNLLTPSLFNSGFRLNRGGLNCFSRRGRRTPFCAHALAVPFDSFEYNNEREELVNQLNELQMNNAALNARWRALEEEARRAGAYPGWLRP